MRLTTTTRPLMDKTDWLASRASIIEAAEVVGYRTIFSPFCAPSRERSRADAESHATT